MNQDSYRNLIAGTGGGLGRGLLRLLLRAIAVCYRAVVSLRNFFYNMGWARSHGVDAVVISVGNITAGGTGKTPLVIWLCDFIGQRNLPCAILTRGYKAEPGKLTDEPAILAKSCPDARVIVDADRVRGANKAIRDHGAKVIVMDDGFQHRRLQRNIDIIAIDATCPFGYDRILPAGLLREPVKGLKRADAVIITRYDQVTAESIEQIEKKIRTIAPNIPIAKTAHVSRYAKALEGETISIEQLKTKKIFAFCGIGNPQAFVKHLDAMELNIVGSKFYNDHYVYTEQDISDIYEEARYVEAEIVLSTQKDWVKTALLMKHHDDVNFAYLGLEVEFVSGVDKIESLIDRVTTEILEKINPQFD